ncbi:MAG: type I DNA topoisomerase [Patescibacteria group bacterium]
MADKSLIIVESPHKAKTIEQFLGQEYAVKASLGHVWDLPKSKFGVDIEDEFKPVYVAIKGQDKVIAELRTSARNARRVFLATDPDREGEVISWHLAQALDLGAKAVRIEFHEITPRAVKGALSAPREIDVKRVNAQQARRVLDRIIGYQLSPLLWRKVRRGLSAGRVQSVAVRLIVERENEIRDFKPVEYWTIEVGLATRGGEELTARVVSHRGRKLEIGDCDEAARHREVLAGLSYVVTEVRRKEKQRFAPAPFTTSTLQQEASRKLGYGARRTMVLAQQLYEGLELGDEGSIGLITYMRTDSVRVAEEAQAEAAEFIEEKYGSAYLPDKPPVYKTKAAAAQEAHECVRPTSIKRTPELLKPYLNRDQFRLYQLIWSRFAASQMAPALLDTVAVEIAAGDYSCRANGSNVRFRGYLEVYQEGRDDEAKEEEGILPVLAKDEVLSLAGSGVQPKQHFTQPPPRYSEAMLVKVLEEKGIGRPSTYAPTIDTILRRNYVQLEEKRFHPTKLGEAVLKLLIDHFPDVVDLGFTADLERRLDGIEEGGIRWQDVVREFYTPFMTDLERAKEEVARVKIEDEVSDVPCDLCGRMMVIKYGRFGKFLACPGFPACRNTKPYRRQLGVACPLCGQPVIERRTKKKRRFYGCSAYPACDFLSWQPPAPSPCPKCGSFARARGPKGGPQELVCARESCGYVGPVGMDDGRP